MADDEHVDLNRRLAVVNGTTLYDKVGELKELVQQVREAQDDLRSVSSGLTELAGELRDEGRMANSLLIEETSRATEALRAHVTAEVERALEEMSGRMLHLSHVTARVAEVQMLILESVYGRGAIGLSDVHHAGLASTDPVLLTQTHWSGSNGRDASREKLDPGRLADYDGIPAPDEISEAR